MMMVGSFPVTAFGEKMFAAIRVPSLQIVACRTPTSSGSENTACSAAGVACCADANPKTEAKIASRATKERKICLPRRVVFEMELSPMATARHNLAGGSRARRG
jgi:hypothetical protein